MPENELNFEVTEDEIKDSFRLITSRAVTSHTLSVGKAIAHIAQWHIVEALKLGLMPIRVGNYYLIRSEVINGVFKKLDAQGIPGTITEISEIKDEKK